MILLLDTAFGATVAYRLIGWFSDNWNPWGKNEALIDPAPKLRLSVQMALTRTESKKKDWHQTLRWENGNTPIESQCWFAKVSLVVLSCRLRDAPFGFASHPKDPFLFDLWKESLEYVHTPRYPKMKDLKVTGFRRISFYFIDCFFSEHFDTDLCHRSFPPIYEAKFQCFQPFQELEGEKSDGKGKIWAACLNWQV